MVNTRRKATFYIRGETKGSAAWTKAPEHMKGKGCFINTLCGENYRFTCRGIGLEPWNHQKGGLQIWLSGYEYLVFNKTVTFSSPTSWGDSHHVNSSSWESIISVLCRHLNSCTYTRIQTHPPTQVKSNIAKIKEEEELGCAGRRL